MVRVLKIVIAVGCLSTGLGAQGTGRKPIEGAWRVTEIVVTGASTSSVATPQPGLMIFTSGYYSIMYVGGSQARKPFITEDPTSEERLAAFDSFSANTGIYELAGTTLTIRPIVARILASWLADSTSISFESKVTR